MPEVHLPHLEDEDEPVEKDVPEDAPPATQAQQAPPVRPSHRSKPLLKILLEVALISAGVFLGLMGEQWREEVQHRELAEASLRRIRAEFSANRQSVASVKDNHVKGLGILRAYFAADPKARQKLPWPALSTDPAFLEYSAWDVALATQSLAYIDSDLAFSIAHVYAAQRQLDDATRGITNAMYSTEDPVAFLRNLSTYFGDCTLHEPRLLKLYDEILPRLDRALGDAPGQKAAGT